jgi:putative transposase
MKVVLDNTNTSAKVLARVCGVSESRIYAIRSSLKKEKMKMTSRKNEIEDKQILEAIKAITIELPIYGYRKVWAILRARYGMRVGHNRVYRIMREAKLCLPASYSHKKLFRGIPFSYKLEAHRPNELWGIDMTYIWCGQDTWCYLHAVIDHYDRTLLGYNFSRSCKAQGAVMAIAEATMQRIPENLELRSDNGCHYGAKIFRDELTRLGIHHTRTMVNTPKGNAIVERFFRSLKEECVWQYQFQNFEQAKEKVDAWIKKYNLERPHQALKYLTPQQFYERTVRPVA